MGDCVRRMQSPYVLLFLQQLCKKNGIKMIREIELNNRTVKYDLQYKRVKNINLRIKPDGSISVSAHRRISQTIIDDFLISKSDFILRALDKYENKQAKEQKQFFSEDEVKNKILRLCEEVYPYYKEKGIRYPQIKFRKMVSRWGSCHTQKGILTFSTNLMYAPKECIEYVVYHEFTHFLQGNHSRKFYNELEKVFPNWKECRSKLKEINIR